MDKAIIETNLDGVKLLHRGKVRDLYEIDDNLLIIATDRISAFDCVFPTGIPKKGEILTNISNKWFNLMNIAGNHIIETNADNFPEKLKKYKDTLKGRSVIVKKAERIDFVCVGR